MGSKYRIGFFFFIAVIYLYGCASESTYLVNLSDVKEAVINYYESGRFNAETGDAVDAAIEKFERIKPIEKSAVIFDIDDTALSDYPYERRFDFGYIAEFYDMWIDSANAPPVPGVLKLYNYLVERNFRIIFLTGRKSVHYEATFENLLEAGYTNFDTLILRDKTFERSPALTFKSEKRKELVGKGYVIEGTVGDQWSDLDGPYHGIQVKIPNYQYLIY